MRYPASSTMVRARVSSPARAGVPAPRATSNAPIAARASRRKAMLAPTPKGGSGKSGLCGPAGDEDGPGEAAPLAVPAKFLEPLLGRRVQPGGQDDAADAPDVAPPAEPRREPGQPVPVGLVIVVEVGDDLAGRRGRSRVAGPGQPRPRLPDVAERSPGQPAPTRVRTSSVAGALSTTRTSKRGYSCCPTRRRQRASCSGRSRVQITTLKKGAVASARRAILEERPGTGPGDQPRRGERGGRGQSRAGEAGHDRLADLRPHCGGQVTGG